jgi:multidrug resistance protein, MATE family
MTTLGSIHGLDQFMQFTVTKSRLSAEIKALLFLALPLAGAQLAQAATSFVDTVMMGLLGQQALAAGALGSGLFGAVILISSSILTAVSSLAALAFGAGQPEKVSQVVRQGFWLAVAIGLPLTGLLWQGGDLLRALGQEEENVRLATGYLRAIAWGLLPALGFAVLRNFVSALSQPRPVIVIVIGGTLFNAVMNDVLMLGKLGFPALGIVGIGYASMLSLWGMFLALVGYILYQPQLRRYRIFQNLQQFEAPVFWELLRIGAPVGVLVLMETGLFTSTTFLMGQIDTITLAAHQIALQTTALTFMVPLGISYATTVRVGQLMGQGQMQEARLAGFLGISLGGLFMSVMALLLWTMPTAIVALYLDPHNSGNAAVTQLAIRLLGVAALFQLFDGIQVTAAGALRGIKDTKVPMMIGIVAYWGLGLPSGYGLGFYADWGGVGLWWGLAIGLAIAASILTWRFSVARLRLETDLR